MDRESLGQIIDDLKKLLNEVAVKQKYNFQHPDVQHVSRTLDAYILEYMKLDRKHTSISQVRLLTSET